MLKIEGQIIRIGYVLEGELAQLRASIADDIAKLVIDLKPVTVRSLMRDAQVGSFEGGAVEFLALAQG